MPLTEYGPYWFGRTAMLNWLVEQARGDSDEFQRGLWAQAHANEAQATALTADDPEPVEHIEIEMVG